MSSYKEHRLLNYLDSPKYFLYWTMDEAGMFLAELFTLGLMGHWLKGLLLGFIASFLLIKLKKRIGYRRLKHFFYWNVSTSSRLKKTPASYEREIL
ncbi:MAG TPA: type IV conjugative transfer system protein TraL [Alphaproteobacteria bacterium]|nr:type IV conjugative transfer system protein TraL [Alphaproteobacteria bacterium]